jgi:hypothetical protein
LDSPQTVTSGSAQEGDGSGRDAGIDDAVGGIAKETAEDAAGRFHWLRFGGAHDVVNASEVVRPLWSQMRGFLKIQRFCELEITSHAQEMSLSQLRPRASFGHR